MLKKKRIEAIHGTNKDSLSPSHFSSTEYGLKSKMLAGLLMGHSLDCLLLNDEVYDETSDSHGHVQLLCSNTGPLVLGSTVWDTTSIGDRFVNS